MRYLFNNKKNRNTMEKRKLLKVMMLLLHVLELLHFFLMVVGW